MLALAVACGRTPLVGGDDDVGDDDVGDDGSTGSPDPTSTTTTGPPPPPPPSCADLGGVPVRDAGPWIIAQRTERASVIGIGADDDALLSMWLGPFDGSNPAPNALGVTVDHEGTVLTSPTVLWERPVTSHAIMRPAAQGHLVVYCGRDVAEDFAMSRIVDTFGATTGSEIVRQPAGFGCGAASPDGIWTGAAYHFGWTDNVNTEHEVLLDLADTSAATTSASVLAPNGSLYAPPRFAVGSDGVVMAAGIDDDALGVWRIDHAGTVVLDPIVLVAPDDFGIGSTAVGTAADGSTWLWIAHRNEDGIRRVVIDAGGDVVVAFEPLPIPTGRYSRLQAEPWRGGAVLTAEAWVSPDSLTSWFTVDDRGAPVAMEIVDDGLPALYEANTAVAARGDHAWVLYNAGFEDDSTEVRMYRLGCSLGR